MSTMQGLQPIWRNPAAGSWRCSSFPHPEVETFHKGLPDYSTTPLTPLPTIAKELGIGHVFIKDESYRFGLPSFKILGASWAIYRTLIAKCKLPPESSLDEVGAAARKLGLKLVTCSEGNWGRACARMAKYLDIAATIFVPKFMNEQTRKLIASEGATVSVVQGGYDEAVRVTTEEAARGNGIQIMDTSWPGYEEIPAQVVDGYSSLLDEVDKQLLEATDKPVTLAIASVGVGSWAQAVVAHFKSKASPVAIATVEPETAACLRTSLESGQILPISTRDTIMCGMNCGTVSYIAWPVLRNGVDISVTVTDADAHQAVEHLRTTGVDAGPCGAAPLAALRRIINEGTFEFNKNSVVVLFSTEGTRPYEKP